MKRAFLFVVILVFCVAQSVAFVGADESGKPWALPPEALEQQQSPYQGNECKELGLRVDYETCITCHNSRTWEILPLEQYPNIEMPNDFTTLVKENGENVLHYSMNGAISPEVYDGVVTFFRFADRLNSDFNIPVKTVVIDIKSFGGSSFDAWGIINVMTENYAKYHIVTKSHTYAVSAGFHIFIAGEERIAANYTNLMWHELKWGEMFKILYPSGLEDEAEMSRSWQNDFNQYIADRSNGKTTKEIVDENIKYKDWWFNGKEGYAMGFVDKIIGE